MSRGRTKKDVIKRLVNVRENIISLIESLPENKWDEIFLGKWTIADFVAHLIGWDIWGRKATKEILQGKLPSYYKYEEPNWATINDMFVKKYKKVGEKDLLVAVKEARKKLLEELEKVAEELFDKDSKIRREGEKVTVASDTLYQAEDEEEHLRQIERWLKTGKIQ